LILCNDVGDAGRRSILVYTIAVPDRCRETRMVRTEALVNLSAAAVAQIMIPVDDFERAIAFYRDVPRMMCGGAPAGA
jgi:hypothetical protein